MNQIQIITCHKCQKGWRLGHGMLSRQAGEVCGCDTSVDVSKASGGFRKCRAKLKAENISNR